MSQHEQTQSPSYSLVFSREFDVVSWSSKLIDSIGKLREEAIARAFNARSRALARINRCRKNQLLTIGDRVFIKDHSIRKLDSRVREEPYEIVELESTNIVKLKSTSGKLLRRSRKDVYKSS